MGIFSNLLSKSAGERAYRTHANANRLNDKGKAHEAEVLYDKAYELYVQAENDGCEDSRILTGYAVLLMRMCKFEKAKELAAKVYGDRTLSADDRYQVCIDHALCQWKLGYVEKALSDMELCKDHHKTGIYYDVMCSMLIENGVKTGDFTPAEEMCQAAMEYDDEDSSTHCSLGWLSHLKGDDKKAVEYLKLSMKYNAKYPAPLVYMAIISCEKGDMAAAKDYKAKALEMRFPTTGPMTKDMAKEMMKHI